jgi:hypothetical protein
MYEYEFVNVDFSWWGQKVKEDYHKLVEDHAKQGWRLVQIFASSTGAGGNVSYVELIFERVVNG